MMHELEMLGVRKNMASSEIREIDIKIANLAGMRKILIDRLAALEQEEAVLEHESTLTLFTFLIFLCSRSHFVVRRH